MGGPLSKNFLPSAKMRCIGGSLLAWDLSYGNLYTYRRVTYIYAALDKSVLRMYVIDIVIQRICTDFEGSISVCH